MNNPSNQVHTYFSLLSSRISFPAQHCFYVPKVPFYDFTFPLIPDTKTIQPKIDTSMTCILPQARSWRQTPVQLPSGQLHQQYPPRRPPGEGCRWGRVWEERALCVPPGSGGSGPFPSQTPTWLFGPFWCVYF